jgi:hypothetical protein
LLTAGTLLKSTTTLKKFHAAAIDQITEQGIENSGVIMSSSLPPTSEKANSKT